MARLFVLFLIVLLPLRGWTAERMVFQMEHGAPVAMQAQDMDAGMSEDCALHMQMASHHAADQSKNNSHTGCQACQLCMPLAALDAALQVVLAPNPQAVPVTLTSRFVSADTARHAKPPIS